MSVISVDLLDSITEKLELMAKNKIEIEKFVLIAVAEKLGYLQERAKHADLAEFEKILAKVPNTKADEFDKI